MFLFPPAVGTGKAKQEEMSCPTGKGSSQGLSGLVKAGSAFRDLGMGFRFRFYSSSYFSAVELFPFTILVRAQAPRCCELSQLTQGSSWLCYARWQAPVCPGAAGVPGALCPPCPPLGSSGHSPQSSLEKKWSGTRSKERARGREVCGKRSEGSKSWAFGAGGAGCVTWQSPSLLGFKFLLLNTQSVPEKRPLF